jgi:hypothetical protein
MAVSFTEVITGNSRIKFWRVIKTADADASVVIPHDMPFAPEKIYFKPLGVKFYSLQTPIVSTVDTTNVTILMGTGVGSGDPSPHYEVIVEAPHSITD